ncbi:PTGES [Cervus elaphus hippelaphus]|uniref:PTGES n=1 Tax=Cervus elaphus hippelaphus TaxID=46360 RepID=A0A212CW22_CEREH|nr:PTGES [Cervus elaphus hippelaphus]
MPPSGLELMNGQVLPAFLLCSALLVIKMYVVAIITGQVRLRKKILGQAPLEFSERNFPHRSESRSQNNNKD